MKKILLIATAFLLPAPSAWAISSSSFVCDVRNPRHTNGSALSEGEMRSYVEGQALVSLSFDFVTNDDASNPRVITTIRTGRNIAVSNNPREINIVQRVRAEQIIVYPEGHADYELNTDINRDGRFDEGVYLSLERLRGLVNEQYLASYHTYSVTRITIGENQYEYFYELATPVGVDGRFLLKCTRQTPRN